MLWTLSSLSRRLRGRLADLERQGLTRRAPRVTQRDGIRYHLDGRPVVGLCSNDYLGLADAQLPTASVARSGAAASRLVCGDLPLHRHVEAQLAELVGAEAAVLFPSGFQLNVGTLPALLGEGDVVHSDRLNHASLVDGMRLSKATRIVLDHLATPPSPPAPRNGPAHWWVTESIFSMDGDPADLEQLAAYQQKGGLLYVDEAHAFGLYPGGRGRASTTNLVPDVLVGTLGKAVGCAGAFVAGSSELAQLLKSTARSFVYSTGMSPLLADRVLRHLQLLRGGEGERRRERLWRAVKTLSTALGVPLDSPILPIVVGDNRRAISVAETLLERGWHVQPIRPPTVPEGTARLRVTLSADHDDELVRHFAADLLQTLELHGVPFQVARVRPAS